ncbi:MAG: hypothetical protein WC029_01050 [Sulfuricella sp.]|jgi:hypothetical protein
MTVTSNEFIQLVVSAIVGAGLAVRMSREGLSLSNPETRRAAFETLIFNFSLWTCAICLIFS